MDENTDQTNFWLAWRATCAVADCVDAEKLVSKCQMQKAYAISRHRPEEAAEYDRVIADADNVVILTKEIVKSTNKVCRKELYRWMGVYDGARVSSLQDKIESWTDSNPVDGCAMMEMEADRYNKKEIMGKAWKSYLFEDIRNRPGGQNCNLFGYVKSMIATMTKESFSKEELFREKTDGRGTLVPTKPIVVDSDAQKPLTSALAAEVCQVVSFFGEYVDKESANADKWDEDHWICLYCHLNDIPINTPAVAELCKRGKTAISELYDELFFDMWRSIRNANGLHGKISYSAVARAMSANLARELDCKMSRISVHERLEEIRKRREWKNEFDDSLRVADFVGAYADSYGGVDQLNPKSKDSWIAMYCIVNRLPVETFAASGLCDEGVESMVKHFNVVRRDFLRELNAFGKKNNISLLAMRNAFEGNAQKVISEHMKKMIFFKDLEMIRAKIGTQPENVGG